MDIDKITSWIYMATAIASRTESANVKEISEIADGINHSVPTEHELYRSLDRLQDLGLVIKNGINFELTSKGKKQYQSSEKSNRSLFAILEDLNKYLKILSS